MNLRAACYGDLGGLRDENVCLAEVNVRGYGKIAIEWRLLYNSKG